MFRLKFLSNLTIGLLLCCTAIAPAMANSLLGDYTSSPNAKRVDQTRNTSGGSRSDCQNPFPEEKDSLTLLVPAEEVAHQTTTARPSFLFYAKTTSNIPVEFTLVDPDAGKTLVEKSISVEKQGYYEIALPKAIDLKPEQIYLWHVAVPCANNKESFWSVLRSSVEYVPPSVNLERELQNADSELEKVRIYLSNSVWYDAISLANRSRKGSSTKYLQQLLTDANIFVSKQTASP